MTAGGRATANLRIPWVDFAPLAVCRAVDISSATALEKNGPATPG
jgi:hypothetical protein